MSEYLRNVHIWCCVEQIQGFDSFKGCADDVIRENVEVFALLMDCLDFKGATMEALFSVFGSRGQYQVLSVLTLYQK